MARSVTTTANVPSRRKETANGKANGNGNGNASGAAAVEAQLDDAGYRDFFWTYTEEPHRSRRLAIIKAHPEVSQAGYGTHGQAN